jgi:carboxypeptidase C (cathepsin A)
MAAVVALLMTATSLVQAAPQDELFEKLLQFNGTDLPMPTKSYSGFLKVNEEKQLHYVFVESEDDPTADPILVWFNGGPGCSSMLAFMQEHGPWVIEDEATEVTRNPYPWNANASVLYLESPAGVGFSPWKVNKTEMFYNDMIQSEDAYAALK